MVKELVPIDCVAAIWGPSWTGLHVLCYCDSMSVVHALNKGSFREPMGMVMHLLRTLRYLYGHVISRSPSPQQSHDTKPSGLLPNGDTQNAGTIQILLLRNFCVGLSLS